MAKTILVVGYGPGISHAVAEKFGTQGFQVAIAARNAGKLNDGVKKLEGAGIKAVAVPADVADDVAVRNAVKKARAELGELTAIHWNAAGYGAGDLLTATADEIRGTFDTSITGLVIAIQEALPDLKKNQGAVLVTDGGFGVFDDGVDRACVDYRSMGLAIANSAKHKTVRLLNKRLAPEGVFVGEVMVQGTVKGTAWDQGGATIEASAIAEQFWRQFSERREHLGVAR
ncbi:MAG: SDR family NAD(P)-dependent oxidoreductase [Archangium sp.]